MRILIAFLLVSTMISCSSSDSESSAGVMPKKLITDNSGIISTAEYFYNGSRLDYILFNDGDRFDYTYSGDLISKVEYETSSGDVLNTTTYFYDQQGRLVEQIGINHAFDQGFRTTFGYNQDGNVTGETFSGNSDVQDDLDFTIEMVYGASGEIESLTEIAASGTKQSVYTFDSKNNPFRNVAGMSKLFLFTGTHHNILTETTTQNGSVISERSTSYTYNSDNFPDSSQTNSNGNTFVTEYQYQ